MWRSISFMTAMVCSPLGTPMWRGAKKAETRVARVEKHVERILDGKGMRDR